eukprot:455332_1
MTDSLTAWLTHFGFGKYEANLREVGLEEFALIKSLDEDMISDIIQEAEIRKLHEKILRKAIKAVRNGNYQMRQLESMKRDNKLLRDVTQGKEPISWNQNADLIKYRQEFTQNQAQKANELQNTGDPAMDGTNFSIGLGKYKVDVKFSKNQK